jgi:hypothetical protein
MIYNIEYDNNSFEDTLHIEKINNTAEAEFEVKE